MSNDSSAFDTGPGRADSTAGERLVPVDLGASGREELYRYMNRHMVGASETEVRAACWDANCFWRHYVLTFGRTPAAISQDDKAPERR